MGYIKEPKGVNFVVDLKPVTEKDKKLISEVISHYKAKRVVLSKIVNKQKDRKKTSR